MRFGEFLRTTVLASAAGASALVVATLVAVNAGDETGVLWVALGWWVAASLIGLWMGRGSSASEPIRALLAAARTQASLPEIAPARAVLNRLWPLMLTTALAAALAALAPQIPAVAAGFMILWACAWRRQSDAVKAIEDRDGARFYVDRTRPWQAISLVRTPGFRATLIELNEAGARSGAGSPPSA